MALPSTHPERSRRGEVAAAVRACLQLVHLLSKRMLTRHKYIFLLKSAFLASVGLWGALAGTQDTLFLAAPPGRARAEARGSVVSLSNHVLEAEWSVASGKLSGSKFVNHVTEEGFSLPRDPFTIIFKDGTRLPASEMKLVGAPRTEALAANPHSSRAADHFEGQAALLRLQDSKQQDSKQTVAVDWRVMLRDDSNYVREEITISALRDDQAIAEVRLFNDSLAGARRAGIVKGSPVTVGNVFLGIENPLAECEAADLVTCTMKRELPLRKGQTVTYSLVVGVSPAGQMRRSFLNYVERERAHPYRTFLHYNSWYDIGFGKPYDAPAVLDVIGAFGAELVHSRGVKLDSFLLDDGWDDPRSSWRMNPGFPQRLSPLSGAAEKYGAGMGVWLSPWGGYDEAKQRRLEYGRKIGLEINKGGFALSGPKYYDRFREVSLGFIRNEGVNIFKIDGTGNVNTVFPASAFDSDFAAAISLIQAWRSAKPEIYVNLTVGTYPSPFWLLYADSIWRGGEDHSFAGVGSWREKWITYRDEQTYQNIVQAGPLFPLNSLMLHGLIYARQAEHLESDPGNDFENEVHDYFGSGTQLQEMYVSHALLSKDNWDVLAEGANWSRRNAGVLRDTHWIGGNPGKLEVYGWAAWSPAKAILTLRNPSDQPQSLWVDVGRVLELPATTDSKFVARSPWKHDSGVPPVSLLAGQPHTFDLQPFEVLNLELLPVDRAQP
jgi:hypothetical protein